MGGPRMMVEFDLWCTQGTGDKWCGEADASVDSAAAAPRDTGDMAARPWSVGRWPGEPRVVSGWMPELCRSVVWRRCTATSVKRRSWADAMTVASRLWAIL